MLFLCCSLYIFYNSSNSCYRELSQRSPQQYLLHFAINTCLIILFKREAKCVNHILFSAVLSFPVFIFLSEKGCDTLVPVVLDTQSSEKHQYWTCECDREQFDQDSDIIRA